VGGPCGVRVGSAWGELFPPPTLPCALWGPRGAGLDVRVVMALPRVCHPRSPRGFRRSPPWACCPGPDFTELPDIGFPQPLRFGQCHAGVVGNKAGAGASRTGGRGALVRRTTDRRAQGQCEPASFDGKHQIENGRHSGCSFSATAAIWAMPRRGR